MSSRNLTIVHTPTNRAGTIPGHWDIVVKGAPLYDSIVTVWNSGELAIAILNLMQAREQEQSDDDTE